jgi:Protein of unknown function (DUF1353)
MELISDGKPLYLASEGKKSFRLIEDWKFQHDAFTPTLVVPEGYKSDLASIPSWIFWWQWGKWNIAAIAHDYIYEKGFVLSDWAKPGDKFKARLPMHLSRAEADMLFYEICLYLGVRPVTAKLMYWAVRLFGRGVWEK